MAGDWIKMRSDLFTHPKVVRISSALKADTLRTVGGLMSAWCLFDAHSEDGQLEGYTPELLDAHLRWDGFAEAMMAVGWLVFSEGKGLILPRFDAHNGQSSKRRATDTERKRVVRKVSANDADKIRTREEKRREEVTNVTTPLTPQPSATPRNAESAGDVCKVMRQAGIADTNPAHPTLRMLLEAGADGAEFAAAAAKAVQGGKGFAYALAIVEGDRRRAAASAAQLHTGPMPAAETAYQRQMRERVEAVAPSIAAAAPGHHQSAAEFFNAIDVTATVVATQAIGVTQ